MAVSLTKHLSWLRVLEVQLDEAAARTAAQAAAFSQAYATMVPMPAIVANRVTLSSLQATNFLGVNAIPIAAARALSGGPLIVGGHSYGGRLTSMAVADGAEVDGLRLFSYPLHPPGKPDRLRTEHFGSIRVPTVFTHGTRDPFGTIDELRAAVKLIPAPVEIVEIAGARHDLAPLRL